MSDQDLNSARRQIDALDDEIVERISHRARLALETARAKSPDGSFYDPAREAQVLRRIRETNPGPLTDDEMVRLFRELMSACLALERPDPSRLSGARRHLHASGGAAAFRTFGAIHSA